MSKGDIYIGVLIALGILAILFQAVITLVFSSYDLISYTRSRTNAKQLASEQMEIIRNMPYADIGTVGGIPSGELVQDEKVEINGLIYSLKTEVVYLDDPFDGTAPTDTVPTDYKRVRVDVSWGGIGKSGSNTVTLISDFSPTGIETTVGGGTIILTIIDAEGVPLPDATVHITADSLNPQVDLTVQSSSKGKVVLPGAQACTACYKVEVTKDGYSSDRTYSIAEVPNPAKPYLTVFEGQLTEASFAIDKTSRFVLRTYGLRESNFPVLGNQIIRVRGEKIIGTTDLDEPVYKYDEQVVTNSSGSLSIDSLEWDNYYLEVPDGSTKVITGNNPLMPVKVLPDTDNTTLVSLGSASTNNLRLIFTNNAGVQIEGVNARLTGNGYDETIESGAFGDPDFGQSYFVLPNPGSYQLDATIDGYETYSGQIDVNGSKSELIILKSL